MHRLLTFVIVGIVVACIGASGATDSFPIKGIKDAFPRDDLSDSKTVWEIRKTVDKLRNRYDNLETSVQGLTEVLTKLENETASMQTTLSEYGESLRDLGVPGVPTSFVFSNYSCGGVLSGKSGTIIASLSTMAVKASSTASQKVCIWTIQTDNREVIKTSYVKQTQAHVSSTSVTVSILEIVEHTNGSLGTKITPLVAPRAHNVFTGPVIYFVVSFTPSYYYDITFTLDFFGVKQATEKALLRNSEVILNSTSGTLTSNEFLDSSWTLQAEEIRERQNYTEQFASILIANISAKFFLKVDLFDEDTGPCKSSGGTASILVITDFAFTEDSSRRISVRSGEVTDCCKTNCSGLVIQTFAHPVLIVVRKEFEQPVNFKLTWAAETKYPTFSFSDGRTSKPCGGVLGGTSGEIRHSESHMTTRPIQCVWAIVPQLEWSQAVTIGIRVTEFTSGDLTLLELTDEYGNEFPDGPKTTNLQSYSSYQKIQSRVLFLVHTAEFASTLEISWTATVNHSTTYQTGPGRSLREVTMLSAENGSVSTNVGESPQSFDMYQVFILSSKVQLSSTAFSRSTRLTINHITLAENGPSCMSTGVSVYTPTDGIWGKIDTNCSGQSQIDAPGMALVVLDSRNVSLPKTPVSLEWTHTTVNNTATHPILKDECGGVLQGSSGLIQYKFGQVIYTSEECVWLVHSPNSSSIRLKLLKNRLTHGSDYLVVNTVDSASGTLRNDSVSLSGYNRVRTFNGTSLLVVSLYSKLGHYNSRITGFVLKFEGRTGPAEEVYRYKLSHRRNSPINTELIEYSSSEDSRVNDIVVIAYNRLQRSTSTSHSYPLALNWNGGVLRKDKDSCIYDSVAFYTAKINMLSTTVSWLSQGVYPSPTMLEEATCSEEIQLPTNASIFHTHTPAFLVIYKAQARSAQEVVNSGNGTHFSIGYSYIGVSPIPTATTTTTRYFEQSEEYDDDRWGWDR